MISRPDSVLLWDESSPAAREPPTPKSQKNRLRIPEAPDQITAESPVDRFGPRLRRWPTTSTTRRPSVPQLQWGGSTQCYSPIEGVQPNFKNLTTADFTNVYSDPQVYAGPTEDIPQLRIEGENYIVERRTPPEQQQQQQQQHFEPQPQPQQQPQQIEPTLQSDTTQALPAEPRHCYHSSMSSEESFEMSNAYSRSRTPKLPSIDIKMEKPQYRHPPAWKVNLIMFALALTTFCTGWVFTLESTINIPLADNTPRTTR